MDAQHESRVKALRELRRASDHMHLEMGKINRLVNEHAEKQQVLADDNYLMEAEFAQKLKGLEVEAVGIEAKIVALKQEKEGMLVDTTEAQKQAALLEKKIALERETQKALDPEVGAAEVRAMQREIHRMRLRYVNVTRTDSEPAQRRFSHVSPRSSCPATTGTRSCRSGRS